MSISAELTKRFLKAKEMNQKELANLWGVSEQYVTGIIKGRSKLSDQRIIELAEGLGEQPGVYLIQMQADKAKTDKERTIWLKLLESNAAGVLLAAPIAVHLSDFASCLNMFNKNPKFEPVSV